MCEIIERGQPQDGKVCQNSKWLVYMFNKFNCYFMSVWVCRNEVEKKNQQQEIASSMQQKHLL